MITTIFFVIIGLLALAAAVVALIASQRLATFRVSRAITIAAPADRIFPLINDVRAFNTWNPYNQKDPAMKAATAALPAGRAHTTTLKAKRPAAGVLRSRRQMPLRNCACGLS